MRSKKSRRRDRYISLFTLNRNCDQNARHTKLATPVEFLGLIFGFNGSTLTSPAVSHFRHCRSFHEHTDVLIATYTTCVHANKKMKMCVWCNTVALHSDFSPAGQ